MCMRNSNGLRGYSLLHFFGVWNTMLHTIPLFQGNIWNNQQLSQFVVSTSTPYFSALSYTPPP